MAKKTAQPLSKNGLLQQALDLIERYGTHAEAARYAQREGTLEVGVERSTFSYRLGAALRARDGAKVPLSENERKFQEPWTA
jgi:hypothetical protein